VSGTKPGEPAPQREADAPVSAGTEVSGDAAGAGGTPAPAWFRLDERLAWLSWPGLVWWLVIPLAIMLLAWQWQWPGLQPAPGFDESWTAGVSMAVHSGLAFGQRVVFTYGPLGFLSVGALWQVHLAQAATAYMLILRFAFALALFASARRTFGVVGGFVIALVVASVDSLLLEPAVFLIFAVWALTTELGRRHLVACAVIAGAFAGLEFLNKVSVGGSLVVLTAVFVLSLGGRRRDYALAALVGFVVSVIVFWTAIGQPVTALPDYVVNSARIALGYGPAVGIDSPGLGWQYTAAVVALALGLWAAWQMSVALRPRQRWGIGLLWVVFWFFAFKEGFVRHDANHVVSFFDAALGGFLAFRCRRPQRLFALLGIAALVVFALAAQTNSLTTDLDPSRNVSLAVNQIRDVLSPSRRAAIVAAGRTAIKSAEPISPAALHLLRGHTVDVWPSEIALAWAYRLDWDPLPVLQSYSAYTTALDELDADSLASSHAPQRILFRAGPDPDGRVTSFDEGMTSRAILCRYRQIYADSTMAVLALGPNRCTQPVLIKTVHAAWGQTVPVPPPTSSHSIISVRIAGVDIDGLESLESFFYKPAARFVSINGGAPQRLVPGTATDGLPLRASPRMDFTPPFNIAANAQTIAVLRGSSGSSSGQPITFSFYEQSFGVAS
jgi:hypothetical protein